MHEKVHLFESLQIICTEEVVPHIALTEVHQDLKKKACMCENIRGEVS